MARLYRARPSRLSIPVVETERKIVQIVKESLVGFASTDNRPRFMLVYQAGIANVFQVQSFNLAPFGRHAKRVYQGDFRTAEAIARGAGLAGAVVQTAACNQAGDIGHLTVWTDDLESQPFSDKFNPVFFTVGVPEWLLKP